MGTILIIEDDHDTRVTLRQTLEGEGYDVFSATNGREGLEILKKLKKPCMVLLDLVLPLMSGEAFLAAQKKDPSLAQVPVAIVTAFPEKSASSRANALIKKPVQLPELLKVVHQLCPAS